MEFGETKKALSQSDCRIPKSILSQVRTDASADFWHADLVSRNVKGGL